MFNKFSCLSTGTSYDLLWTCHEPSNSVEGWKFLDLLSDYYVLIKG